MGRRRQSRQVGKWQVRECCCGSGGCIEKHESAVFQFVEAAELVLPELEDLRLFCTYYRHCLHFADPTVPAALPHAETLQHAETLPLAKTPPLAAAR